MNSAERSRSEQGRLGEWVLSQEPLCPAIDIFGENVYGECIYIDVWWGDTEVILDCSGLQWSPWRDAEVDHFRIHLSRQMIGLFNTSVIGVKEEVGGKMSLILDPAPKLPIYDCCCSVTKSCQTLCNPLACNPVACQAPLSSTISRNLLKFMSTESVMSSNHLSRLPASLWRTKRGRTKTLFSKILFNKIIVKVSSIIHIGQVYSSFCIAVALLLRQRSS